MSQRSNKEIVRRYFEEALDGRNVAVTDPLFTSDCLIHRPGSKKPLVGLEGIRTVVSDSIERFSRFETRIHDMIAEGDRVVCRVSHLGTYKTGWTSRLGQHSLEGKKVNWDAIAIFRIKDGKIAEEWVCRDELGMLLQVGVLQAAPDQA